MSTAEVAEMNGCRTLRRSLRRGVGPTREMERSGSEDFDALRSSLSGRRSRGRLVSQSSEGCDLSDVEILFDTPYQTLNEEEDTAPNQRLSFRSQLLRAESLLREEDEPEPDVEPEDEDEGEGAPIELEVRGHGLHWNRADYVREYVMDEVDVSYGRIRPLRRWVRATPAPPRDIRGRQSSTEGRHSIAEEILSMETPEGTGAQEDDGNDDAQYLDELRERQEQTLIDLLQLRASQFRIRNRQMLSLLRLLREHSANLQDNSEASQFIDDFHHRIRLEVLVMLRNLLDLEAATDTGSNSLSSQLTAIFANHREAVAGDDDEYTGASEEQLQYLETREFTAEEVEHLDHCTICMVQFQGGEVGFSLSCGHYHHETCLRAWLRLKDSCPVCRQQLPPGSQPSDAQAATFGASQDVGIQTHLSPYFAEDARLL